MPVTAYVPMRPPEKGVTREEMWSKLAKNAKTTVEAIVPKLPPVEWGKPVKTGERSAYILSLCGRYSITKDVSGETITYTAWRRARVRDHVAEELGIRATAEEAKALCAA